ncbi:UDP-glucose 4-epimerase-like isoform X2 [Xenia sp. Carnegie-2017]|uniref:UDP-glucose 4-epimerase-like isoform X2 n=1 Tax=Xenia sp. Carnegie-2017 TaxID=2897299 RepID=UPI001F04A740|nr:UDP-glucose 4-epimerase-like isoform X2 [Xenia sp. Carnegie-2017]
MASSNLILVTGGAGYIGSHTVVEVLNAGYEAVIIDNFCNSTEESVKRIQSLTGKDVTFYKVDLLDRTGLDAVFEKHKFCAVMHFAGLKAVGESVSIPLKYYKNNIQGTIYLLESMKKYKVKNIVFSSSATVYGNPRYLPLNENHPSGGCTNPYGKTKYFIEEILRDLVISDKTWNVISLRYFNPIGAHRSGRIGEDPQGIPNNLMPYITQVAVGRRSHLNVFGNDYETPDGTGVRDYIHVVDLALGHVAALKKMLQESCEFKVYNLGTGRGQSVLEMVKAVENASGKKIEYKITDRRPGDVASCYADPSLAEKELGWKTHKTLKEMCEDSWRWQSQNPHGYRDNKENENSL